MKTVAIIQSNYIPWKGYFDIIRQCDEFIFYDTAIYTARTWRNRNQIKTSHGLQWLVIPVHHDYMAPPRICDTRVVDQHWRKKHWKNICQHYAKAPYFKQYSEIFEALYLHHSDHLLSDINVAFIKAINGILGIDTKLTRLSDYVMTGDKDQDLIELCKQAKADTYLSGPVAKHFLNEDIFKQHGIAIRWMEYAHYPEYPQLHPPFAHEVSILDLIFNTGPDAMRFMTCGNGTSHAL